MDAQRQYLADNGYYIRKLNQAYFAFYGTYGDSPTSASPIGRELDTLRGQSASLKDFLDKVASMTSVANLDNARSLNLKSYAIFLISYDTGYRRLHHPS